VFHSIGSHRAAFAGITADLVKAARTLVVKLIKDKKTGLATLRDIRTALGAETFNLIADGMADSQIKSVAANLDKHHPELTTSNAAWRRRHVDGSVEPAEKPKSAPKKEKAKKPPVVPKTPERISFVSAGATRKR
jgi:16S rRNA G1207 methylase RsmC